MNTTAMLLIDISAVVVGDILVALYFRSLADKIESGETVAKTNIEPAAARRMSTLLIISAPVMWLIVVLICFGVIPSGLEPPKF